MQRVLPPSTGTDSTVVFDNLGRVRNHGFEGLLNARLLDRPRFGWDVGVTGSTNSNRIADLVNTGDLDKLFRVLDRVTAQRRLIKIGGGRFNVYFTEYGYITPGCYRKQWVIPERAAGTWWPQVVDVIRRPAWHIRMFMPYMVTANPARSAWSRMMSPGSRIGRA